MNMNITPLDKTLRLLLVEDNPGDQELVRDWLGDGTICRFEVSAVATLEGAREAISSSTFDAVVLDLSLPDSQGVETISRLRAACDDVPILVLSGASSDELRLDAIRAGAQDFIGKNESPGLLLARGLLFTVERYCTQMQRNYLEGLVAANPDAVLVVAHDGTVRYANRAALELFDWNPDDYRGHSFGYEIAAGVMATIVVPLAGDRRIAEMRASEIEWQGNSALLVSLRDRTEYKRIEEQLRQSQKMDAIGVLAGGVAHDFNNLLTVINGYVEVVLAEATLTTEHREMLEDVEKAGKRAASLTGQLLAFSRKAVVTVARIDLNDVVTETGSMLRRLIGEDISLELSLSSEPCEVLADRSQLEQVILNLAVNARDAMERGGTLKIGTSNIHVSPGEDLIALGGLGLPPGDYIHLRMQDSGPGISPEILEKIFEPFFTTKAAGKGTGLGLATVYGIVTQMGGQITCVSAPEEGALFNIYYPSAAKEVDVPVRKAVAPPTSFRGNETVLLVEDDTHVREFARRALTTYGYTVLEAADGMQALHLAQDYQSPIHVLVSDVIMPNLSGAELGEKILVFHPEVRILYVSGYSNDAVVRHGVAAGQLDFLEKPFTPSALAAKIRTLLDKPAVGLT